MFSTQYLPIAISAGIVLILAIVAVSLVLKRYLRKRAADKKRQENELAFWKEIVGEREMYSLMEYSLERSWKEKAILQPVVDDLLKEKAVNLNVECAHVTELVQRAASRKIQASTGEILSELRAEENKVRIAKDVFWQFANIAKKVGFLVKDSYKQYLPEGATPYDEELTPQSVGITS